MARISFTASFRRFPRSIAWAIALFVVLETGARLAWHPAVVGQEQYRLIDTSYNYGHAISPGLFRQVEGAIECHPTQYCDIHGQSFDAPKRADGFRIFTLGGSVSRADSTGNYSYFLNGFLSHEAPNTTCEVINLSVNGFGSSRMLLLMERAMTYEPDLFIVHVHGSNEYEDERDLAYARQLNSGINRALFQSNFAVIAKKYCARWITIGNALPAAAEDEMTAMENPENLARWDGVLHTNLHAMVSLAEKHGVPILLVGRADKNPGGAGFRTDYTTRINRIIRTCASPPGVTYFDTSLPLARACPGVEDKEQLFVDGTHWTERGHWLIASELADVILARFPQLSPGQRQ